MGGGVGREGKLTQSVFQKEKVAENGCLLGWDQSWSNDEGLKSDVCL